MFTMERRESLTGPNCLGRYFTQAELEPLATATLIHMADRCNNVWLELKERRFGNNQNAEAFTRELTRWVLAGMTGHRTRTDHRRVLLHLFRHETATRIRLLQRSPDELAAAVQAIIDVPNGQYNLSGLRILMRRQLQLFPTVHAIPQSRSRQRLAA